MSTPRELFPDLVVSADEVALRPMGWPELHAYAEMVQRGLFIPGELSTTETWFDPHDLLASSRAAVDWQCETWAALRPDDWTLDLAVLHRDELVGVQLTRALDFPARGIASTGTLIASEWRGRGFGTKARAAALHLVFDVLGADSAMTSALQSNEMSRSVSQRLGYREVGVEAEDVRGERMHLCHYYLDRATWTHLEKPWVLDAQGTRPLLDRLGRRSA